ATLPEDEYDKEQEVIRREFAMGFDDPDRMSSQLLFATSFQQHPYKHPVIGHLDIFNKLTREDVLAYYRRHYVPNNMLFVIVGAVDAEKVHAQIATHFENYPRQVHAPVIIPPESQQLGRRDVHQEFETQLSKMHLAWHIPSIAHSDMPALDVLASILGQGRSSRLYRAIREERQLAHSIGASAYTPAHGGIFSVSATVDPDKRLAVEGAVHELIAELALNGIRPDELEKSKKSCLVDMLGDLTTMRGQANDLATNWMLSRNLNFTRDYLTSIHNVEVEAVRSVAQCYLIDANLSSVSLNPKGSLATAAVASKDSNETVTHKIQLGNGLTVLLQEDHRVPLVTIRASFLSGLLGEDEANTGLTQLGARCLIKGTANRTASEIADSMENAGGGIGASAGNNTFTVSASCLDQDLPMALDIVSDVLLRPSFPKVEVEREKVAQVAGIKSESDHLISLAVRELRQALFGEHPYANVRNGTEASVNQLDEQDVHAFHERYATGKNGVLSVYGAIDRSAVEALIREQFDHLPPGERAFQAISSPEPLTESTVVDLTTDKQQAVLVTGYPSMAIDSPDRLALELIEEACSDMSSRLFMKIREEMGLAYYVSASQMFGLAPGVFYFYCGTDPEKLDDVQAALAGEVSKLAADGLTQEELARAKQTLLGKAAMDAQGISARASIEGLDELYQFGHDHGKSLRARVEKITLEDTHRVLKAYFCEKPSVTVRVSPLLSSSK
ncbi:MAG: M16 family metallopeptidase, partial [Verrucomicrobiales bacterium]